MTVYIYWMKIVEKLESWSVYKYFEAESLEEALELAKNDKETDWQYTEDDSIDYYFGGQNA